MQQRQKPNLVEQVHRHSNQCLGWMDVVVAGEVTGTKHVFDVSMVTLKEREWSVCEVELPADLDAWLVLGFTGIGSPTGEMVAGVAKYWKKTPPSTKKWMLLQ